MKLPKAMVRRAWAREPGLRDFTAPDKLESPQDYPNCAAIAVGDNGNYCRDVPWDLWYLWVALNNEGFSHKFGVTPVERRDCMLALLDAGAFDAWLE